jgi:hypothetical protein
MSTGRKRSSSGPACSSPAKRKKYLCKYQKAWEAEINWLSHGDRSVSFPISPQNCSILLFKELFGVVANKDIDFDFL